jgi:hypothetical protein
VTGYKLVAFDGYYYFVNGGTLTMNKTGYLSEKFVAGTPLKPGYYEFDETGKIILKNGDEKVIDFEGIEGKMMI